MRSECVHYNVRRQSLCVADLPACVPIGGPMPEDESKAMRGVAPRRRSTVGLHSGAAERIGKALASLEDPREQRFVERYVETNNGTQSAIVAGYSVKSARTIASQL